MPTKNALRGEKFEAVRNELAELNARAWRERRGEHDYAFHPVPVDDATLSSRLFGPITKTVQWEATSK